MKKLTQLDILTLSGMLGKKEISAAELSRAYLREIREKDGEIGAYLWQDEETTLKMAENIDARRLSGEKLPALAGIPAALKDNIVTRKIPTTCASRMLSDFIPPYNAHVVEKLEEAGYVLLGKLNMDEFAMGSTTENSAFKVTRNPRDPARVPGGSSGGSAAAVAAGEAAYTLGSDTGGSIRQPAAFCGVVGMKPTYGRVSRYGLVAFASSLDQIGPLTRTVRDNALVFSAIAGKDSCDATSLPDAVPSALSGIGGGVSGLRIGLPRDCFEEGIAPDVKAAVLAAAERFRKLGASVSEVSLPTLRAALPAYYVLSSAEASSNLSRFDGVRYGHRAENFGDITELYVNSRTQGFGAEVKRRIMLGTFALSSGYYDAYYKKALQVRALIRADFDRLFEHFDLILSPVAPTVAYRLGEKSGNPLEMYLGDIYSVPANVAGIPALSLPCGTGEGGMPVGLQLMGRPLSEALLYRAGAALEDDMGGNPV